MAARDCLKNAVANPCNHLIDSAVDGVLSYSVNSLYIPLSQSLHDGAGHRFVGPILCCNPYPGSSSSWSRLRAGSRLCAVADTRFEAVAPAAVGQGAGVVVFSCHAVDILVSPRDISRSVAVGHGAAVYSGYVREVGYHLRDAIGGA